MQSPGSNVRLHGHNITSPSGSTGSIYSPARTEISELSSTHSDFHSLDFAEVDHEALIDYEAPKRIRHHWGNHCNYPSLEAAKQAIRVAHTFLYRTNNGEDRVWVYRCCIHDQCSNYKKISFDNVEQLWTCGPGRVVP